MDEIYAEMLKHGKHATVNHLTDLFNSIWREQKVSDDWREGIVVKLPKKDNLSDCNNWRGITLLSTQGKVFCKELLNRLQSAVDCVLERSKQASEKVVHALSKFLQYKIF